MADFLYQKTVYQGYLISDLIDEVASYRVHKNELDARVTDLLSQLEQRGQGVQWHPVTKKPERWPVLVQVSEELPDQCFIAHEYNFISWRFGAKWSYIPGVSK